MAASLPFEITADATERLKGDLVQQPQGMEPALITQLGFETYTHGGKLIEHYMGEHFGIVYYNPGERPQALHIELFGHFVSIVPGALERLRGRTLTIRRVVVGSSWFRKKRRDLLVAV